MKGVSTVQNEISRRAMLQLGVAAPAAASAPRKRAPNILVIMSDEHNHRVAGFAGNRTVETPHLDRLAARGVVFENAYCNSPLCVPSRLAFTAGKYIHRISAWNNACWLPRDDYPSLPGVLNAAGYESFLCGKQHYDASHRYGFREIGGNMNNARHLGRGGRRPAADLTENPEPGRARFAEFKLGEESSVMKHDRGVTAGVLDFLAKRGRGDRPFFLFAGYLAPHFPLTVPERYWKKFQGRIPMPAIPAGFLDQMPLNYKHLRAGFGVVNVPAETIRFGRELYYGLTGWVDDQIGQVQAALSRSPFADNTVVIYTSDHGENMGEHGMWWKNCVYEQAAHIPMVVSWPQRWRPGRRQGACSMVDLVRTIAEVGGARVPDDWDGRSMLRQLDDAGVCGRDLAVSQYYAHNIASGYAMLRQGDWKYVYHAQMDKEHPAFQELYDLKADPGEFRNLAEEPPHRRRVEAMQTVLLNELGEHPDETEQRCRAELARGYSRPDAERKGGKKPGDDA